MPMDGDAIYKNFWDDAHGTGDYETAQDTITKANKLIGEVGDEVHKHAADLEGYWKGDAADAAKQGLGPIAYESQYSRDRTDKAWDMLCQQSLDFHDKKNTVQKMPDKPGGLVDGLEAAATGGISAYVKQKNYNDTGMGNVKAMNDWTSATNTRTSGLPTVPPSSLHDKGGVVPTTQTHGNVGDPSGQASSAGSASGSTAASATSATGATGAPATSAPSAGATATPHTHSTPEETSASSASPSYASPEGSAASPSSPSSSYRDYKSSPSQSSPAAASAVPGAKSTPEPGYAPSDSYNDYKPLSDTGGTSAAGFEGAPISPAELGGGSSSYVPTTSTPPVSSNTPGTYSGLGLTPGAPLAEEPGTSGRMSGNIGSGARSGGVPGSGARSGMAEPTARGGAGVASEGAGGRTAGAAGRPGTSGAPMGAGRGKGKGDEKEHQRRFVADEQLDDGLDTDETEQGTLTRDAEGNVVPPEVIGDQQPKPTATTDGDAKPAKPEGLSGRPKETPEPITAKPEAPKPKFGGYRGTGA